MPRTDLTDLDFQALARFRHQLRKFLAFSEAVARKVGLEPRQHQLLLALRGLPPDVEPSVQRLAELLVVKHHTVVELVDRLEAAKLVRRERDAKDRRRARISITAHGLDVLKRLSTAHIDELRSQAPALVGSLNAVLRASRRSVP